MSIRLFPIYVGKFLMTPVVLGIIFLFNYFMIKIIITNDTKCIISKIYIIKVKFILSLLIHTLLTS